MNIFKKLIKKITGKKIISHSYLNLRGFTLLSAEETLQTLSPYCIKTIPPSSVELPDVMDENNPQKKIFKQYIFTSDEVYAWQRDFKNGYISTNGSVVINNKVLCTDWDHRGFENEFWKKDNRPAKFANIVIPLLSHHQDMNNAHVLTGYYDFMLLVAAKLSRIKDAITDEDLQKIIITYYPFGGNYEKQYLELLGFNPDNYIDSRTYKLSAEKIFLGNCGSWKPNVGDILSLKRNVEKRLNITEENPSAGNRRIYISRKGRREIENENELIELLKKFNFIIIEDKERSVEEQINIYRNASFIIGPHGASFANVIWCKPGTHLYELFSKSWAPDYFLYLATINHMQYSAYQDDTHEEITHDLFQSLCQNIYVSIPVLQTSLEKIFNTQL